MKKVRNILKFFILIDRKIQKIVTVWRVLKTQVFLFGEFVAYFSQYIRQKVVAFFLFFERYKNILVRFFLMKRGRYNRPFLHIAAMAVMGIGVLIAPFLADTYPVFSNSATQALKGRVQPSVQSIVVGDNVFQTSITEKPRDKVLIYTVEKGDTVSTIAKKFGISTDTVRWNNNMSDDDLVVGDELKIPPVTGIVYKVSKGESIYTIAKKYSTEPQKIVDFPFNDFANPETFSLVDGQMLVVPDGVPPSEQPTYRPTVYIAQGPVTQVASGGFTWPLHGLVTQFASWYHMALDIAAPVGTPLVAAQNGTVTKVSTGSWDGGYGNNVTIDNGAGFQSHYAHLSSVSVGVGQQVVAGSTVIGRVGITGRTTGAHVHFEILRSGALVNPLSYLQ